LCFFDIANIVIYFDVRKYAHKYFLQKVIFNIMKYEKPRLLLGLFYI